MTEKRMTPKEYIEKMETYRCDSFINPKTGLIYNHWRPRIRSMCEGLDRFVNAQNKYDTYQTALKEIKEGKKKTHWIWFVFPQRTGLGKSEKSDYYGIDREEAEEYLKHPILGKRLIEATEAVYNNKKSVYEIFGHDAIKVCSCMKLFASVSDIPIFKKMIEKYNWH